MYDTTGDGPSLDLLIVLPTFNDWEALQTLLPELDRVLNQQSLRASILLVDDASTLPLDDDMLPGPFSSLQQIHVLSLKRNLGHQRAIAVGLSYAEHNLTASAVVVMDADGEDAPQDVPRLVERLQVVGDQRIIFAERTRRSEHLLFQLFYRLYQVIHLVLTGIRVRVGNFSIIPYKMLPRVTVVSEIWNHYAAGVFKSRMPYESIPTQRGRRIAGRSRMNFINLVIHGLSALSVQGEIIGVRLIVATVCLMAVLASLAIIWIAGANTAYGMTMWMAVMVGSLFFLVVQASVLGLMLTFIILQARVTADFLPTRDYHYFVEQVLRIYPRD